MGERIYQKIGMILGCLLEIVFPEPSSCSACGRAGPKVNKYKLCNKCNERLIRFQGNDVNQIDEVSFDACIVACSYEGIAKEMIYKLKYKDKRDIAFTIGAFLGECIAPVRNKYDAIVPVPVSKRKRSTRGYNHARLISEELSKVSGIELVECLERLKDTKPQVLFNVNERWYNVKGCFKCVSNLDNKRILLIDDIVTTGATAHNCAEAMKACGAKNVTVLAFAKSTLK